MTVLGVDLHPVFQGDYRPQDRHHFVIIKASEGRTVPAYLATRPAFVKRFRDAGKIIGHYHWIHQGNVPAQFDNFVRSSQVLPGDLIALDWEEGIGEASSKWVSQADMEAWLRLAKARFPRNRVVVYTAPGYGPWARSEGKIYLADGLWIADVRASSQSTGPRGIFGLPWVLWQFTWKDGTADLDQDKADFPSPAAMRDWLDYAAEETDWEKLPAQAVWDVMIDA